MSQLIKDLTETELIAVRKELNLDEQDIFNQNVEHFTENEGPQRDEIVEQYFGKDGMNSLIESIVSSFKEIRVKESTLLDLGSGTGTFLLPVAKNLDISKIIAFDLTPKMLTLLEQKITDNSNLNLITILGDMERIHKSFEVNKTLRSLNLPDKIDLVMSTLALHHIPSTEKVLEGISKILSKNGRAIIIDAILSDTSGMEPTPEHPHDGFDIENIQNLASKYFGSVNLEVLDITCSENNSETDMFMLFLEL